MIAKELVLDSTLSIPKQSVDKLENVGHAGRASADVDIHAQAVSDAFLKQHPGCPRHSVNVSMPARQSAQEWPFVLTATDEAGSAVTLKGAYLPSVQTAVFSNATNAPSPGKESSSIELKPPTTAGARRAELETLLPVLSRTDALMFKHGGKIAAAAAASLPAGAGGIAWLLGADGTGIAIASIATPLTALMGAVLLGIESGDPIIQRLDDGRRLFDDGKYERAMHKYGGVVANFIMYPEAKKALNARRATDGVIECLKATQSDLTQTLIAFRVKHFGP
jgi:hypothetical protein